MGPENWNMPRYAIHNKGQSIATRVSCHYEGNTALVWLLKVMETAHSTLGNIALTHLFVTQKPAFDEGICKKGLCSRAML